MPSLFWSVFPGRIENSPGNHLSRVLTVSPLLVLKCTVGMSLSLSASGGSGCASSVRSWVTSPVLSLAKTRWSPFTW
jgi:hypothetical protein